MKPYDHKKIEPKWQKKWDKEKAFAAIDSSKKPKWYSLIEFPYPSGDGLHVGHIRSNTAMDIISRKRRREGYNVLYPIGWDAFGLPTENYAIKTGIQPALVTKKNTAIFRRQLKSLGFSFDWSREINTTDPKYYKWTQWIFLQFLKSGLAYKKKMAINWCPKDLIGLANEEVIDGKCERCGTPVERREKEQWMLAITKYADRLDKDLDLVDYLPEIKAQQRNWIGKSEGAEISFLLKSKPCKVLLIHGFEGNPDSCFSPWLKTELQKLGYEVHAPSLPNSDHPNFEEMMAVLEKEIAGFGENDMVIGHSMGGHLALKIAEGRKLGKIILIAPAIGGFGIPYKEWKEREPESDYDSLESVLEGHKPDFLKIDTREKIALFGIDDPYVPIFHAAKLDHSWKVSKIDGTGHFEDKKYPEILQATIPSIKVFTTRPDTLFGVTYLVLAPEHALVRELLSSIKNRSEALIYITRTKKESDISRTDATREKTGVELKGVKAINPVNGEEVPVYIADYVLADYGTGAVMAVPAHDDRDFAFAKKYNLPIKEVIMPTIVDHVNPPRADKPSKLRANVHAIVFDPKQKKYLIIRNDKHGWDTVVIGGIEANEDPIEAAKREVREETGYTDIEFKKKLGSPVRAEYFAKHKDENRIAIATGLYFELKSDARVPITDENGEGNQILWIEPADFVPGKMVNSELPLWLARLHSEEDIAFTGEGLLIDSGSFNDKKSAEIKKEITAFAGGQWVNRFKLRDWIFSRQRYWGEPIPVVHCEKCGIVPVPEKDLPVKLPKVENYKPTETGESPLAAITKWVYTKCPNCKGHATRETDTMPNWAGSSWYYLRYCDPLNAVKFADMKKLKHWTPVDWYNGGMEHVTLHLLYSRFWHKFLFDQGLVPTSEPYVKRTAHGFVLGPGGEKMSKSRGNVINPDTLVKNVGADSLRLYEMFMGPFDQAISWDENGIVGCRRFLERVWKLQEKVGEKSMETGTSFGEPLGEPSGRVLGMGNRGMARRKIVPVVMLENPKLLSLIHKTIKKVSEDIESMRFNTAVSALMILLNEFEKSPTVARESYEMFLRLLAPFAPHITEELWNTMGNKKSIHAEPWQAYNPALLVDSTAKIAVQINGKTRAEMEVTTDATEETVKASALALESIKKWLNGKVPSRIIVVKGRLVNIVVAV